MYGLALIIAGVLIGIVVKIVKNYIDNCEDIYYGKNSSQETSKNKKKSDRR